MVFPQVLNGVRRECRQNQSLVDSQAIPHGPPIKLVTGVLSMSKLTPDIHRDRVVLCPTW